MGPQGRRSIGTTSRFLAVIALMGCTGFKPIRPGEPVVSPGAKKAVELVKSGCYGSCPAYDLVVWDGDVATYRGLGPPARPGEWWRSMPPAAARQLRDSLLALDGLRCGADAQEPTHDAPVITLTVFTDGGECVLRYSSVLAPPPFHLAASKVLEATSARELTGERR